MSYTYVPTDQTLDRPINWDVEYGVTNKAVQTAISVIQNNYDVKVLRDNANLLIQRLFELGFQVADPSGTRKITAKMLQQAIWRSANRMKFLSFDVLCGQRDNQQGGLSLADYDRLVTAGVDTVMTYGGLPQALRDKDGLFQKLLMWGDAFMMIAASPVGSISPIMFTPISNSNVYFDSYCTSMRGSDIGKRCKKMCVIFSMSWATFIQKYPEMEKKAGIGQIPRDLTLYKELERNYLQTYKLQDEIEVAHYYDLDNMNYTVFAGSACTVIEEYKGDDYPFQFRRPGMTKKEAYIPVSHFLCMPSTDGFYNHGLGDALYDLAILTQRFLNMAIGHAEDNTYPITLANVPEGQAAMFFNKLEMAGQMRAAGKKPVVAMEYDPSSPNSNKATYESLLTQNMMQEWQIVFNEIDRQVKRLGINLDEVEGQANITAFQVRSQLAAADAWGQQIGTYNATESQFIVEVTMDMMKQFVKKSNELPIDFVGEIELADGQKLQMRDISLGAVAQELRDNNYFVKMDPQSGVIPTDTMQMADVMNILEKTTPGSKASFQLQAELARLSNHNFSAEDFAPAPMPGAPSPSGGTPAGVPQQQSQQSNQLVTQ